MTAETSTSLVPVAGHPCVGQGFFTFHPSSVDGTAPPRRHKNHLTQEPMSSDHFGKIIRPFWRCHLTQSQTSSDHTARDAPPRGRHVRLRDPAAAVPATMAMTRATAPPTGGGQDRRPWRPRGNAAHGIHPRQPRRRQHHGSGGGGDGTESHFLK